MNHILTYFDELKNSQEMVDFLETAALKGEQWQVIKGIYKNLEKERIEKALVAVITTLDQANLAKMRGEERPSAATLGYMKRRAARFMRQLAKEEEALYVQICLALFKKQTQNIDWNNQWILANILVGNSSRYVHSRHGRGKVVQVKSYNIFRTEEKAPDIWDKYLDEVADLLQTEGLAWEVYDFAAKVLARNKRQIFGFSLLQVERFFESSSPWLWSIAVRECFEAIERGLLQNVKLMAYTYFYTNPVNRQQLLEIFQQIGREKAESSAKEAAPKGWLSNAFFQKVAGFFKNDMTKQQADLWLDYFVEQLSKLTFKHLQNGVITRRILGAFQFLKQHIDAIPVAVAQNFAPLLLKSEKADLEDLVFKKAALSKIEDVSKWLIQFKGSSIEQRQRLYKIFKVKFSNKTHYATYYRRTWFEDWAYHDETIVADFAWFIAYQNPNQFRTFVIRIVGTSRWSLQQSLPFKNLFTSNFGQKLVLQHAKSQLQNWLYYKDAFLYILKLSGGELKDYLINLMVKQAQRNLSVWIFQLVDLDNRDNIWQEIVAAINYNNVNIQTLQQLLIHTNPWIQEKGWHILTYKKLTAANCEYFINAIIINGSSHQANQFLQQILLLENEGLKNLFFEKLKQLIKIDKRLLLKVAPIFKNLLPQLSLDGLLSLAQTLDAQQWENLKEDIRSNIIDKNLNTFWQNALKLISTTNDTLLFNRLIQDKDLYKTFFKVRSIDILEVKHPIFAQLLGQWVQHQEALFQANSPALLKACVHPLPSVRDWALARATTFSLSAAFALQLMETGVPDTVTLGKDFFLKLPKGDANELEYILMLCDSPKQEVRAFGMRLFEQRKENLHSHEALASLSEHPDSYVQAFVAEHIVKTETTHKPFVPQFDKAVMRTQNRSRKAKELVKKRLQRQDFSETSKNQMSTQTLLELARGKNKLDAEWAIQQLTKMALAGGETELVLI